MPADPYPPIAVTSPPVMVTSALLPVRSYPYEPPIPAPNLPPWAVTTPPVMVMFEPLLMNPPPMPAPGSLPTAVTVPPAMVMFEPFCLRSPPMPAAPPPSAKSEPCPDMASGFSPFRRPAWPKVDVREFSPSITRSSPPDATENAAPGFSAVVGGRCARVRHRDGQRRLAENREDAALIGEIDALLAAEHIEGAAIRVSGPREDEGTARRKDDKDPRPANRRRGLAQPGPFRRLRSPHTRRLFSDPSPSCTIGSPFYHGPKAIR